MTAAMRLLRRHGVAFTEHEYAYEERGGTRVSARELGVPEHQVVKTLVMEDERGAPLLVLMHGDREVSTRAVASPPRGRMPEQRPLRGALTRIIHEPV